MDTDDGYVSVDKIAEYFGIKRSTVLDWRKTLGLPSHRFGSGKRGGTVLFKMTEVKLWAQRHTQKHGQGH